MPKKKHSYKELIISDKSKRIYYISNTYKGVTHDFSILKEEFPTKQKWFANTSVRLDLGFQGIADCYDFLHLTIPHKKKRVKKGASNQLTDQQIQFNKQAGRERIYVEHSIAGMKRYKILVHRCTNRTEKLRNITVGVCAALWNYTIF